jgi:hypothetical protein
VSTWARSKFIERGVIRPGTPGSFADWGEPTPMRWIDNPPTLRIGRILPELDAEPLQVPHEWPRGKAAE